MLLFVFLTYFLSSRASSISARMSVIFLLVRFRGSVVASSVVYSDFLGPSMRRLGNSGG